MGTRRSSPDPRDDLAEADAEAEALREANGQLSDQIEQLHAELADANETIARLRKLLHEPVIMSGENRASHVGPEDPRNTA